MSKVINFTALPILPALLDKSKTQTIRKAYDDAKSDTGENWEIGKPARFKVGDKATLMWNQRSSEHWFCKFCGTPVVIEEYREQGCSTLKCPSINCDYLLRFDKIMDVKEVFPKVLGEVEITEVFKITMDKDYFMDPVTHKKWLTTCGYNIDELAERDSFKSAEDMFAYFDKVYDLSTPRTFWCYRWKWL